MVILEEEDENWRVVVVAVESSREYHLVKVVPIAEEEASFWDGERMIASITTTTVTKSVVSRNIEIFMNERGFKECVLSTREDQEI